MQDPEASVDGILSEAEFSEEELGSLAVNLGSLHQRNSDTEGDFLDRDCEVGRVAVAGDPQQAGLPGLPTDRQHGGDTDSRKTVKVRNKTTDCVNSNICLSPKRLSRSRPQVIDTNS